jgi:hypothetical protein
MNACTYSYTTKLCPLDPATLIHRSAWKVDSANFVLPEFSEDEMRRPTLNAVPLGLQLFDGL